MTRQQKTTIILESVAAILAVATIIICLVVTV